MLSFPAAPRMMKRTLQPPRPPWVTTDLRQSIPNAQVLVYGHGEPENGCTLRILALRLLDRLLLEIPEEVLTPNRMRQEHVLTSCSIVLGRFSSSLIVLAGW
jgi:hypothetical protein